jgi:hypothetical protein
MTLLLVACRDVCAVGRSALFSTFPRRTHLLFSSPADETLLLSVLDEEPTLLSEPDDDSLLVSAPLLAAMRLSEFNGRGILWDLPSGASLSDHASPAAEYSALGALPLSVISNFENDL